MEVFIDESGRLDFGPNSHKYFIVGYIFLRKTKPFREDFRYLLLRLQNRYKYFHDELKFSQSNDSVRRKGLQTICQHDDCGLGFIIVHKRRIDKRTKFYRDIEFLYRYVIADTVMNAIVPRLRAKENLILVVDKRIPESQRKTFDEYAQIKGYMINQSLQQQLFSKNRFSVCHRNSKHEPCLQAADFVAGAEFHLYEHNNPAYHKIIQDKIRDLRYWP